MPDTVGPPPSFKTVAHINAIGYLIAGVLAFIFLPLLPFVAILWLVSGGSDEPSPELGA